MTDSLIQAVINNNIETLTELLNQGANIDALDTSDFIGKNGEVCERTKLWSAVDLAICLNRKEIANYLLEEGAIANSTKGLKPEQELKISEFISKS